VDTTLAEPASATSDLFDEDATSQVIADDDDSNDESAITRRRLSSTHTTSPRTGPRVKQVSRHRPTIKTSNSFILYDYSKRTCSKMQLHLRALAQDDHGTLPTDWRTFACSSLALCHASAETPNAAQEAPNELGDADTDALLCLSALNARDKQRLVHQLQLAHHHHQLQQRQLNVLAAFSPLEPPSSTSHHEQRNQRKRRKSNTITSLPAPLYSWGWVREEFFRK
jgi:hypothetical protein